MRTYLTLFLLAAGLLAGCSSPQLIDMRGEADLCEIHHAYMHAVQMSAPKEIMPSQEYLAARVRYFPHARPFYLPKMKGIFVVNICDDCVRAEAAWKSQHNGQ